MLEKLITFVEPPKDSCPSYVGFINDTYKQISRKNGTRKFRGETGRNIHIDGFEQHMPQGLKWVEFLNNNFNKEELINLISQYLQSDDIRKSFTHPFIVTCGEATYNILSQRQITSSICNHAESDTSLVKHALDAHNDSVMVSKDTAVLVILIWAYSTYDSQYNWYMKYDTYKYASIKNICEYPSPELCKVLPAFHAITGCDATSYFFRKIKQAYFKSLCNYIRHVPSYLII